MSRPAPSKPPVRPRLPRAAIGFALGAVAGVVVGLSLRTPAPAAPARTTASGAAATLAAAPDDPAEPVRSSGYRFISPLVECERARPSARELVGVGAELRQTTQRILAQGRADHVSVYFRDLNNGPWFGIEEQAGFSPASLLKVPVMMTLLRLAEDDPQLLSRPLTVPAEMEIYHPNIVASQSIEPGQTYTIRELIDRMVRYSDNRAAQLLIESLDVRLLAATYREIGLPVPQDGNLDTSMTVKQYAGVFRILYNATFLTRPLSEWALETLSRSEFRAALVAGVPAGTTVAHKFGERGLESGRVQLHDCGIVYAPDHPYLLCVMTQGASFPALAGVIEELSRTAFMKVKEHHSLAAK